jgi:hypothetical protein
MHDQLLLLCQFLVCPIPLLAWHILVFSCVAKMYRGTLAAQKRKAQPEEAVDHFSGTVFEADLSGAAFLDINSWFLDKLLGGQSTVGFGIQWRLDVKRSNNPIALLQFSDGETAVLLRTHTSTLSSTWLPDIVRDVLASRVVRKVCSGSGQVQQKLDTTFGLTLVNYVDIRYLAESKGLEWPYSLQSLATKFRWKMRKPTVISRSNWQDLALTRDQIDYAAEVPYFAYRICLEMDKLPNKKEEVDDTFGGLLELQPGWDAQSIHRDHDGFYCRTCSAGPMRQPYTVIAHITSKKHLKTYGKPVAEDTLVRAVRVHGDHGAQGAAAAVVYETQLAWVKFAVLEPMKGYDRDNFLIPLRPGDGVRVIYAGSEDTKDRGWLWGVRGARQGWVSEAVLSSCWRPLQGPLRQRRWQRAPEGQALRG